ncbi:hypothetical protein VHUM_03169 [Vanrija humicola]|uniref:Cytochrome P450 n=1 Tax=Vanrija humicola TaxID=5417 RepID=A0A7D8V0P2_VANHU|nr:hypothetical protein VHUM_03169 [Vanrija humicola]
MSLIALGIFAIISPFFILAIYRKHKSVYKNIPGPPPKTWVAGNLLELVFQKSLIIFDKWVQEYGSTYKWAGIMGVERITTVDPGAINFILQNVKLFVKPKGQMLALKRFVGDGLVNNEGAAHRRQRRALNPAFSPAHIRELGPVFHRHAENMKARMDAIFDGSVQDESVLHHDNLKYKDEKQGLGLDMLALSERSAGDTVASAMFGYEFNFVNDPTHPVIPALRNASYIAINDLDRALAELSETFPWMDKIHTPGWKSGNEAKLTTWKYGKELVEKRQAQQAEVDDYEGKDVLSLLAHSTGTDPNLREDLKLSSTEALNQFSTAFLAGTGTTGAALAWAFYYLAKNPKVQEKLREELNSVGTDEPDSDTLHSLVYLENFTHELMRIEAPVPLVVREPIEDIFLPVSRPIEGMDGTKSDSILVSKGTMILIPIQSVNRDKRIWGEDALEFNPDRFDRNGLPAEKIVSSYGNILSFIGGLRNCIGFRFSMAEFKHTLFSVLRHYSFEELPSTPKIAAHLPIAVTRPHVVGMSGPDSYKMPLVVRRLDH